MISEEEIKVWWERKIENYIKNYARQNKLSLMQEKTIFFYGNTSEIPWEHTTSNPKISEKMFMTQPKHR